MNICGPPGGTPNPAYQPFHYAPCTNFTASPFSDTGHNGAGHAELQIRFGPHGLRRNVSPRDSGPGGGESASTTPRSRKFYPYQSDQLKNYEFGWKTQWFNEKLQG